MKIQPSRIERYFELYEFNTPYLLCASDCEAMSISELLNFEESALDRFLNLNLGYTETRGHPDLRVEICKLYETVKEEDIIVFAGAEEGVFCILQALLQPGDHYIVQHPNYQSLEEIPRSIGCHITHWKLSHINRWQFDIDFLADSLQADTRAIAMINPHNPTGALMSHQQQNEVIELASKNGVYIFSDEVYRFSEYDATDRLPAAVDLYDKAISLGVMSKSFGLPGLRIGWMATRDRQVFRKIAEIKDFITICNSAPSEFLATIAMRNIHKIVARNIEEIGKNIGLLDSFFERHQDLLQWVKPKAGPIAMPGFTVEVEMEAFCQQLRKEEGVLLLPGSIFDYDESHFRLGFGRRNLPQALERFDSFLQRNYSK